MKKFNISLNLSLFITVIILLFLYIFSFYTDLNKLDSRTIIKTQLINQKNKNKIKSFKIQSNKKFILIQKCDDFWIASDGYKNYIPCDQEIMTNFIDNLTTFRNMYKLTDNFNKNNTNFGFLDDKNYQIEYELDDGSKYQIYFGNQDFSYTSRYLKTGNENIIYEIDNSLNKYLSTIIQNWSDPFILSNTLLGKITASDIQSIKIYENQKYLKTILPNTESYTKTTEKIVQLRNGGFAIPTENDYTIEYTLHFEFGNKNECEISFYNTNNEDNDYNIITQYKIPAKNKIYTFSSKISIWTYNKIKEIML